MRVKVQLNLIANKPYGKYHEVFKKKKKAPQGFLFQLNRIQFNSFMSEAIIFMASDYEKMIRVSSF